MDEDTRGRIIALPIIGFALVLVDQSFKQWAVEGGNYVLNPGISWGLLKGIENINTIMIGVATFALILFIYLLAFRDKEFHSDLGLLLLIGGTAGNLIDRVTFGSVIDFIRVGSFPVFNLADAYLTIGVVIVIIATAVSDLKERHQRRSGSANDAP